MNRLYVILLALMLSATVWGADGKVCWGYGATAPTGQFGSRTSAKGAIYVPAEVARLYQGCTVSEVQVGLAAASTGLDVFVTKTLGADPVSTGSTSSPKSGTNSVSLSAPYTIDGSAFYVGYSYSGTAEAMGCSDTEATGACWADLGSGWADYSSEGKALCIRAVISGDMTLMPVEGAMTSLQGCTVEKEKAVTVSGSFVNLCPSVIRSFRLAYRVDGGEEHLVDFAKKVVVGANTERDFTLELDPFAEPGLHTVSVRLVQLGGKDDAYEGNNSATCQVDVRRLIPVRRMVMENNTGLDCGWCPRGIVAIRDMYEKYPDHFIGIEVFTASDLSTETYREHFTPQVPLFTYNRTSSFYDTNAQNVEAAVRECMAQIPEMQVSVEGAVVNGNQLQATATTLFTTSKTNASYRIAFVVTEDSIQGYSQQNYFAGGSNGSMGGFESLGSYTKVPQNHVARQIYEYEGYYGSVPYDITAFEPMTFTRTLDLPASLQSTAYLHIIALLFDHSTGEIVNAAEASVTGGAAAGIAEAHASTSPAITVEDGTLRLEGEGTLSVYTPQGGQVPGTGLQPGLYLVRVQQGTQSTTRKIIIR